MKVKSPAVFDLIQTMTKAEKIYYKRSCASNKGKITVQLQLFDALCKMPNFSLKQLQKKLKDPSFLKHKAVHFANLYKELLASLNAFHLDKMDNMLVQQMIGQIRILLKKRLFKLAEKEIKRTKKFCQERELYISLFILGSLEFNLSAMRMDKEEYNQRKIIVQERLNHLKVLEKQNLLFGLNSELGRLNKENNLDLLMATNPTLVEFEKTLQLIGDVSNDGLILQLSYYGTLMRFAVLKGQNIQAWKFNRAQITTILQMPKTIQFSMTGLSIILYNYFYSSNQLLQHEEITKYFYLLEEIKEKETELIVKCEGLHFLFNLNIQLIIGDFEEVLKVQQDFEVQESRWISQSTAFYKIQFYEMLIASHFLMGNYNQCLSFIQKAYEIKDLFLIEQYHIPIRMIEIAIHFEKGNLRLLESLILAVSRMMDKTDFDVKKYQAEINLLKGIRKSIDHYYINLPKNMYTELYQIFQLDYAEKAIPPTRHLLYLKSWLEAKIEDVATKEKWNLNVNKQRKRINQAIRKEWNETEVNILKKQYFFA